jgi:large subunit ribosomal protein L32e
MIKEKMLSLRKKIKAKKPTFLRQEADKISKLRNTWRKPKGSDSKMRKKFRCKRKLPSLGYSSPRLVRGLNSKGLEDVLIHNISELHGIDKKSQAIIVAKIGKKKKIEILKLCKEKELVVSNVKDIDAYMKKVAESLGERKDNKKNRKEKQKKSKDSALKKKKEEKKEETEDKTQAPETKKGEKSDKIKTLEKRQ